MSILYTKQRGLSIEKVNSDKKRDKLCNAFLIIVWYNSVRSI